MLQNNENRQKYSKTYNWIERHDEEVQVYDKKQQFICTLSIEDAEILLNRAYYNVITTNLHGYAYISRIGGKSISIHKEIFRIRNINTNGLSIDHKNHNRTDQRFSNLQLISQKANTNRRLKVSTAPNREAINNYMTPYHNQRNLCIKYHSQLKFSTWKDMKIMLEFWSVKTDRLKSLLKSKVELRDAINICVSESQYYRAINSIKEALE